MITGPQSFSFLEAFPVVKPNHPSLYSLPQRLSSKWRWICSMRPTPWSHGLLWLVMGLGIISMRRGKKSHYISWQCLSIANGVLHTKREVNYLHLWLFKCCAGLFMASYANPCLFIKPLLLWQRPHTAVCLACTRAGWNGADNHDEDHTNGLPSSEKCLPQLCTSKMSLSIKSVLINLFLSLSFSIQSFPRNELHPRAQGWPCWMDFPFARSCIFRGALLWNTHIMHVYGSSSQ